MTQFTLRGLMKLTFLIAVAIVVFPLVIELRYDILWAFAFSLILCAQLCDWFTGCSQNVYRWLISLLHLAGGLGLALQWLRFDPSFEVSRLCSTVGILFAIPSFGWVIKGRRSLTLSSIGSAVFVFAIVWQLWGTRHERYFFNRSIDSYDAEIVVRDGGFIIKGGQVHIGSSTPFPDSKIGIHAEIETLIEAANTDRNLKLISQLRIVSSVESISSLSFLYEMNEDDWYHLMNLKQLAFLDFNSLTVVPEANVALASLQNLQQLAFFGCSLPENILVSTQRCKKLHVVQIVECQTPGIKGLFGNTEILALNLKGTKLTVEDLNGVASLLKLIDLDLRDTGLSTEDLDHFVDQISSQTAVRFVPFSCKLNYDASSIASLIKLAQSGSVFRLEIYGEPLTKSQRIEFVTKAPGVELVQHEIEGTGR